MNISRIALLTVLFSAPSLFSMETPTIKVSVEPKGYFATAKEWAVAPFVFGLETAPNRVANFTKLNAALAFVVEKTHLNYDCVVKNTPFAGRLMVLGAATFAAYKAYAMYNANETSVEVSEDFFAEDTN